MLAQLQAMCAGHVPAVQAAASAAKAAADLNVAGKVAILRAVPIAAHVLPDAVDSTLVAPLVPLLVRLPEVQNLLRPACPMPPLIGLSHLQSQVLLLGSSCVVAPLLHAGHKRSYALCC